jgi:hypothetical protein
MHPLWTADEYDIVRGRWPDVDAIRQALPHRSVAAVINTAARLGIRKKLHVWTAEEDTKLRRMVRAQTPVREIARALGMEWMQVQNRMNYAGVRFSRRPLKPTGDDLKDSIRRRAHQLNFTLVELDAACGTGQYFQGFGDRRYPMAQRHLAKALQVLGGRLRIEWEPAE